MRRSSVGLGLGLGLALVGCAIDVGEEPPPPPTWGVPITGGTMTVTKDGTHAVVADPDRDRVYIVDLVKQQVSDTIELAAKSEPGRVIEDDAGRIHVALRGSGELLTITGTDRELRYVCGEPRGLAAQGENIHVACATGELVTLAGGGGDPTRVVRLERDLRDVIVRDDGLAVTTFRSAQVLRLDDTGAIIGRVSPPAVDRFDFSNANGSGMVPAVAEVAWRTVALPDGRMAIAHQRRMQSVLRVITGGYGGGMCNSMVESSLSIVNYNPTTNAYEATATAPFTMGALPVDIAVSPTNGDIAMATAGDNTVNIATASSTTQPDQGGCGGGGSTRVISGFETGTPTSVAYRPDGSLLIYYPEANSITIVAGGAQGSITLGDGPRGDAGRSLFHSQTFSGLACASCHPEGRDDGAVWAFDIGIRRTQNLGGGIMDRAPYHWGADMPTLHVLVQDVFTQRMGGTFVTEDQERALAKFLDRVPAPRGVVADSSAVSRGEALFNSPQVGCATCHAGALMTTNQLANVGTAGTVKVPSLIGVGGRAPFMHDGCAATLRDRFGACGGGDKHGITSQLTPAQIDDLVAYLDSL